MSHWTLDRLPDQSGRVAIVTGANSGIGFEAAAALAACGAHVVLACRNKRKALAARDRILSGDPQARLQFIHLDLASLASVERFADSFRDGNGQLDLLINNAGVMTPPFGRTEDGFELQFGCNHLGHFALTGRLLDLLTATEASRVVVVSSVAHRIGSMDFENLNAEKGYDRIAAYGQSKLANLLFAFELQRRLRVAGSGVVVNAAHPGWTGTDLQRHSPTMRFLNAFFAQKPAHGALPTLRAAVDPDALGGDYFGPRGIMESRGFPVPAKVATAARNEEDARRLWEVSERLTEVRFLSRPSAEE